MPESTWPKGAITSAPIKRNIDEETALGFAHDAFIESDESFWAARALLRRWFLDEWDGGGVVLEDWKEASVLAIILFRSALAPPLGSSDRLLDKEEDS